MSRIGELIAELCPDGVEFRAIERLVAQPANIRWADQGTAEFQYIDLTSVERATHAITETTTIASETAPARAQQIVREGDVIFGTTRPMLKRYAVVPPSYDGQICSTGFCVLRPDNNIIITNFLFHLMGTDVFYDYIEANERGASYPAISNSSVKKFRIPVPPLEIQQEVVAILDKFTKLEAELEAELEARRQQYQHYRDTLLSFDDHSDPRAARVRLMALGEICNIKAGQSINKIEIAQNPGPYAVINSGREPLGFLDRYNTDDDPIGITSRGAGVGSVTWCEGKYYRGNLNYSTTIRDSKQLTIRFLYHSLIRNQSSIQGLCTYEGIPALNKNNLEKLRIPVPPREEQDRIVAILDRFDALVNNLSSGLPAEIAARRRQYEYYRDRLLTFREAA